MVIRENGGGEQSSPAYYKGGTGIDWHSTANIRGIIGILQFESFWGETIKILLKRIVSLF